MTNHEELMNIPSEVIRSYLSRIGKELDAKFEYVHNWNLNDYYSNGGLSTNKSIYQYNSTTYDPDKEVCLLVFDANKMTIECYHTTYSEKSIYNYCKELLKY